MSGPGSEGRASARAGTDDAIVDGMKTTTARPLRSSSTILVDADVCPVAASALLMGFAGIAQRDAARPALDAARAVYFSAEEWACRPDATEEDLAAWRTAEAAYRAIPGAPQW